MKASTSILLDNLAGRGVVAPMGILATMVMGLGMGCSHATEEPRVAKSEQSAADTSSETRSGAESVDPSVQNVAGSEGGTGQPGSIRVSMSALSGSGVSGEVTFTEERGEVVVTGTIRGLQPKSEHGLHVHSIGVCSGDGSSAGEHFDPRGQPHGPLGSASHVGDLGNVTADNQGAVTFTKKMPLADLEEGPYSIAGRALIVHAKRDDLHSQPSGDSGDRIACGVIGG